MLLSVEIPSVLSSVLSSAAFSPQSRSRMAREPLTGIVSKRQTMSDQAPTLYVKWQD